jgi:hypothetical protein
VYDEAVREALGVLWEASDRICGKRLKALLVDLTLIGGAPDAAFATVLDANKIKSRQTRRARWGEVDRVTKRNDRTWDHGHTLMLSG